MTHGRVDSTSSDSPQMWREPQAKPVLLVSVRDAEEARVALDAGAEWIDLKEPRRGALGAVEPEVARETVEMVGGRVPVSAACGELREPERSDLEAYLGIEGLSLLKFGTAGCTKRRLRTLLRNCSGWVESAGKQMAVAAYADSCHAEAPDPMEVLDTACDCGVGVLLIDTYDKNSGSVLNHLPPAELAELCRLAKSRGLGMAVAGSVTAALLPTLIAVAPDVIGVRGAACEKGRESRVSGQKVASLINALRIARKATCAVRERALTGHPGEAGFA